MGRFRAFLSLGLALLVAFVPIKVFADEGEQIRRDIVTEYYSPDLTDPPIFDATETVAPIGTVLEIPAKSCILMEVNTGQILYESESHMKLAPASITKIMALLLVVEAIDSGLLSTETVITASDYACSMGGSQIWLEPGEQMSVNDLLKAAVIGSANDATVALGEAVAGSEEGFVKMMNDRAAELGLKDTNFLNSTGLDADGHLTSAHDIAVASCELIKHDIIKNYSTVWMDSLRNGESELVNTNKLVRFYEGCTGLKTGTTSIAGACLSATAERNGLELCAVVMGAGNSNDRFQGARKLLDYGFANYTYITASADESELTEIAVKGGTKDFVEPICNKKQSFLIEKSKAKDISVVTELPTELKAPISEGQQIGVARVLVGREEIATVPITAKYNVDKMTLWNAVKRMLGAIFAV